MNTVNLKLYLYVGLWVFFLIAGSAMTIPEHTQWIGPIAVLAYVAFITYSERHQLPAASAKLKQNILFLRSNWRLILLGSVGTFLTSALFQGGFSWDLFIPAVLAAITLPYVIKRFGRCNIVPKQ